jgi:FkbM family methyltransferase
MIGAVKRFAKRRLIGLASRYLDMHVDPPRSIVELSHPLGLLRGLGVHCSGVIHVGANNGQEFDSYISEGVERAVYIEPVPEVFKQLEARVAGHRNHRAIMALCADREGEEVTFNVSSNSGLSSSMLDFGRHAEAYPDVTYVSQLKLRTTTLDRVIETLGPDFGPLDCLVLDVQGAEAKVIAGAERTLATCKAVFTEVSEGGLYRGGADMERVLADLKRHGFKLKALELNKRDWGNALLVR